MSRRSDYLDYIADGGLMSELQVPMAPEDNGLYKMAIGGFGMEKSKGFYRCKVHNTGAGNQNFVGGFLDLGENSASSVKIKVVATVLEEDSAKLPTQIGIRLFANNSEGKEDLNGGYSKFLDNLVSQGITHNSKHTFEATFSNDGSGSAVKLETYRYLKPFIAFTKGVVSDKTLVHIHEFTLGIGNVIYDIRDSVFNFQEGLESDFRYMRSEIPTDSVIRRKMPLFGKKIACLGDSITFGYNPGPDEKPGDNNNEVGSKLPNPWCTQLREKCGFLNTRNHGLSGRMIASNSTNAGKSFIEEASKINADVDVITVMGGINDFANGIRLGKFVTPATDKAIGENVYAKDTFYGALQSTYETLLKNHADKLIVVINMLNGNNGTVGVNGAKNGAQLLGYATVEEGMEAYREAIRMCANYYNLPCLELQDKVSFNSLDDAKLTNIPDLLHPNQVGHNEMADVIAKFINSLA